MDRYVDVCEINQSTNSIDMLKSNMMILIQCVCLIINFSFVVSEVDEDWRIVNASQYCPSQRVCGVSPVNVTEAMCCKGCQCDDKCKERNDCCFRGGVDVRCVTTAIDGKAESYYMETARVDLSSNESLTVQCKDDNRPNWLQTFPVYSKTTRQIYINRVCAEAHGVYDYEEATLLLKCLVRVKHTEAAVMTAAITALENNRLQAGCQVQFKMPHSLDFIVSSACDANTISYCPSSYMQSEGDNAISKACYSDFHAPVFAMSGFRNTLDMFKNVYCAMCHSYTVMTMVQCERHTAQNTGSGGISNVVPMISLLIDNRDLAPYKQAKVPMLQRKQKHHACFKQSGEMNMYTFCRPILCPWGRIRDNNWECVWASMFITLDSILVTLKLSPTSELHQSDLSNVYNVNNPWPQQWEIYVIEYNLDQQDDTLVDKVYVGLRIKQDEFNIEKLLYRVKKYSTALWTIQTHDSQIMMTSFLSETNSPHDDPGVHSIWKAAATKDKISMTISIVHFCHHILLSVNEFIYQSGNNTIMSLVTGRAYNEGEFIFAGDLGTAGLPRVCVNDSGFVEVTSTDTSIWVFGKTCLTVDMTVWAIFRCFKIHYA